MRVTATFGGVDALPAKGDRRRVDLTAQSPPCFPPRTAAARTPGGPMKPHDLSAAITHDVTVHRAEGVLAALLDVSILDAAASLDLKAQFGGDFARRQSSSPLSAFRSSSMRRRSVRPGISGASTFRHPTWATAWRSRRSARAVCGRRLRSAPWARSCPGLCARLRSRESSASAFMCPLPSASRYSPTLPWRWFGRR